MKKELNLANVLISLIMLAVGVILVINSEAMINMMSWFIGIVIILISIIKIIYFFNDKILNTTMLAINILLMIFGVVLISFPSIVDIAIKVVFGSWILFAGVKRLILAVAVSRIDRQSYKTFLISALVMIALGVLVLINFYNLVGIFLIAYSATEIVNYIYFLINKNKYGNLFDKEEYDNEEKRVKKKKLIPEKIKDKKAIDADIEE